MSANSGPLASTKADSASKPSKASYDHLDINKLYKGKTSETVTKTVAQKHGMQALGKALPARRPGQVGSLKSENSTEGSNSLSGTQNSTNAVGSSHNQVHPSSNQPPPGWTGSGPPPQGTPSPRPAQVAPGTGQGHPQDKSWSGGSDRMGTYPSQRFAQEFPSLDSGMDAKNTSTSGNQNSGPGSSSQGPQSMAKGQDNQYGPGPILRPQTEGSWIQGGGRGMGRPGPGEFAALNPPSGGFSGQDRGNMGGPTPPPMSLGQGGPNSQQMPGYAVPQFRGIMPPNHFMFANGPPPGPGVFYPGMPRFSGMPVPPAPPRSQMNNNHNSDSSRDRDRDRDQQNRGGGRGPPAQRPSSHFANNPIIKDADLKRMDEIGVQDGGWASVQDDVDYSKTISFGSDEEEGKGDTVPSIKISSKTSIGKNISSRTDVRRDERDSERNDEQMTKLERIPERRPKILERQQSNNTNSNDRDTEDRRQRDASDRDVRDRGQRQDSGASKDGRNRDPNSYKYEQEEERKPGPPQGFPPTQQHASFRRPPYEEKSRDPREDRRVIAERGGRRPNDRRDDTGDNWRSGPPRQQQYDEERKGSQPRIEVRNPDPREFAGKPHMNNLPPRLQRQHYQTNNSANPITSPQPSGTNQRQTPSPVATTSKDKDAPRSEWEADQEKQNPDRRRLESEYSRGKREGGRERRNYDSDNRYGNDQHRESRGFKGNEESSQSPPNRSMDSGQGFLNSKSSDAESPETRKSDDSKPYGASKSKMSWADEMDDDENHSSKETDDLQSRKSKQGHDVRINQQFSKPDYYTQKYEERQKRVILAKNQRKVSDMQSEKVEPQKEVKQQTPPVVSQVETKKPEEQQLKVKPVSAWGDRESREKILKSEKEPSSQEGPDGQRDNGDREDRRSVEKDSGPLQKSSSSSSVPGRNTCDSGNLPSAISDEASTTEHSKQGGRYSSHRVESDVRSSNRSDSVSDISDRDHLERESVGSQDSRSKRGSNYKQSNQDRPSHNIGSESADKQKHRLHERERREKTNSERDGSDDGSISEKNVRGGRQNRYPVYNPRGHRGQWDRPGNRGRGRGGSQYYDKPQRRIDSDRDSQVKDERESDRTERHQEEVQLKEERRPENAESPNGPHQDARKDEHSQDESDGQRVVRKDRDGDAHNRKNPKNTVSSKRGGSNAGNSGNQRTANKIEGYGPPSDQKPFSNPGSKASDEESGKSKEKSGEANQTAAGTKDNAIPSLMAFEISPPTMAQFKKGQREREFHPNNRTAVPPRLQRGQGLGTGTEFNERERFQNRPKRGGKSHGGSGKKDGEETEESTDNESDNDSRKSGGTNNKPSKESGGGYQQVKKKNAPQKAAQSEKDFDASVGAAPGQATRGNEKKGKQVKYLPYDARSAQTQLPPRLAKQRDSQGAPSNAPGSGSNGNIATSKEGANQASKGVEPAAPPATSAWEKPIASSAFRPEKAVGHNSSSSMSNQQSGEGKESAGDLKVTNQALPPASSPVVNSLNAPATGTTVLDGTNPPAQTMIFENRNFKGGFSDVNTKSSASKLPESKKDSLNSLESVKGLGSIGFGKGHGEGSPELNFGSFEETGNAAQAQSSVGSMMTSHGGQKQSTTTSMLQQTARHAFDHQSPISPCAAELTEKIKQVQKVWETPSMASVHEQSGVFGGLEDGPFHNAFGSDSFKSSDGTGRVDYGPSSLQQGSGGFSGGSSPSLSAIAKPESSSSPNLVNSRQPNKPGQQQPPIAKAPGHQQTIPTPFNNYGIEQQHPIGTKNFGNIPLVTSKVMFPSNVPMTLDPFGSQYTQYQNPGAGVIPFSQGGSVMIRPVEPKSMYPTMYGQPQVSGVASQNMGGHGQNHNSVSPGPVTSSGNIGSNGGGNAVHMNQRSNMVSKPSQQNRNAPMNQPPPGSHHNYYHSHHNTLPQQQMHKGGFGPTNGGYSDASLSAYQQQPPIIIPVENPMYNLGANFDSSDLRSGPSGPVPPGTPPVQSSSNYYFGSNNNPCVYPPSTPSQNYGHPFGQSLKLSGFNSGSGSSDQGSNLSSQRIREHHSYMPGSIGVTGMEPLPQNAMKSGHDFVVRQQSWSHGNEYVQQMQWNPSPIQRPIYPQSTAQVMPSIVPNSHYMQGPGGPGCVGGKPQNQSNDSMGNNPVFPSVIQGRIVPILPTHPGD